MAKRVVVGLDIGTTHVRGAEVEQSKAPGAAGSTLLRYGQVPLPLGAVRDGEVAEPETVASALRQLWRTAGFKSRDVVLGIGNQRVLVRELEMPAMPMAQIRSSLPFQVQDLLPVAVEDALLDYYPTSTFATQTGPAVRGLLVAATKDTVMANTLAVEAAGLRPVMVDLNAFALVRALVHGSLRDETVALLDIGARHTTVAVVSRGAPTFVRLLPTGGQDITDALTSMLGCSVSDAETLKREIGLGMGARPDQADIARTIADVAQTLVEGVRNTFTYYAGAHPGASAEKIVLTGGGAQLPGLGQYVASVTRLSVFLGDALHTYKFARSADQSARAALAQDGSVAAGLALGAAA